MLHDIIDNRNEKLVEHINLILDSTEKARFAVGYFFLSGFQSIAEELKGVKELRLLIGNATNRRRWSSLSRGIKGWSKSPRLPNPKFYPKRADLRQMTDDTAENISQSVEFMDQTDDAENLIKSLVEMITEKRLLVRVYTKGRLHAKAYIFDYRGDGRYEKGRRHRRIVQPHLVRSESQHRTECRRAGERQSRRAVPLV